MRADHGKPERLFRAVVTAFCSLTRPSRREIAQLEDLTLPLYESVSTEARRFVAAALSECQNPPAALVRRLADEPVETAAPLLLRSNALTDIDLIALIGRRGIGHARVIACRPQLNPTIGQLIRALTKAAKPVEKSQPSNSEARMKPQAAATRLARAAALKLDIAVPGAAAEAMREKLRAMMRPSGDEASETTRLEFGRGPRPALYAKLRDTALTGVRAFFQTALADALGIDFRQAQAITGKFDFDDLLAALKFLELPEEQAFVVTAALYPTRFGHAEAIRLFLERYHLCHRERAADKVRGWKAATLAAAVQGPRLATESACGGQQSGPARSVRQGAPRLISARRRDIQQLLDRRRSRFELDHPDIGIEPLLPGEPGLDGVGFGIDDQRAELAVVGTRAVIGALRRRPEQRRLAERGCG